MRNRYIQAKKIYFPKILLIGLLFLLQGCFNPSLRNDQLHPTTSSLTKTTELAATVQISPTSIWVPTPAQILVTSTAMMETVNPTRASLPGVQNSYASLTPGQYLIYFEGSNGGTVNAVSKVGKIITITQLSTGLESLSANGRYYLYGDYIYDFIKNTQVNIHLYSPCQSSYSSLSWTGTMFTGFCNNNMLGIERLGQNWVQLINSNSPGGDLNSPTLSPYNHPMGNVLNYPTWSPDGKQIAYARCISADKPTEDSGIYIVDVSACLDGAKQCNVEPKGPYLKASCPNYIAWSPDSRFVAGADDQIRIANIKTNQEKTIVSNESGAGLLHGIAWSPDGKWVGFAADNVGSDAATASLYRVPWQGGKPVLLNPNTQAQVWAWLNVIPIFKVGNAYAISIMGDGQALTAEASSASPIVETLHKADRVKVIYGPIEAENQTWWKLQTGTSSGWIIENYDWFTSQ
ncbi:MAG: hypothetical protein P4L50_15730 [Anaerolineaceae bacterium]|nr:hypothetical protein [Anaerolineaceae bacterium]